MKSVLRRQLRMQIHYHLLLLLNNIQILIIKHQNLKDHMHHHQNNHLPPDLMHLPDTKAKRQPNQSHLYLSQLLKKTVIQNKLKRIRKCKKTWHSLQSTSKSSTNLPTTTLKLLQTPETRIWILLQGTRMTIRLGNLGIKGQ